MFEPLDKISQIISGNQLILVVFISSLLHG